MNLEELKKQFIVDEDALKSRLEPIIAKALRHCKITKGGDVITTNQALSAKDKLSLILAARALASELDAAICRQVTAVQMAKSTGLPSNQVRARAKELVAAKFAVSPDAGVFEAVSYKIEPFLDDLDRRSPSRS